MKRCACKHIEHNGIASFASRRPQDFGRISFVCGLSKEICQKVDVQSLW